MYARDQASTATPIGIVTVVTTGDCLESIRIGGDDVPSGTSALARAAIEQIEAWLAGERIDFDLPLSAPSTGRGQELRQWLIAVGYGDTISYGALAKRLGSSARAIGQLCARNPYPLVVPCHRVLGAGGSLGAYSAGEGSATKAWLLAHEQRHRPFALTG